MVIAAHSGTILHTDRIFALGLNTLLTGFPTNAATRSAPSRTALVLVLNLSCLRGGRTEKLYPQEDLAASVGTLFLRLTEPARRECTCPAPAPSPDLLFTPTDSLRCPRTKRIPSHIDIVLSRNLRPSCDLRRRSHNTPIEGTDC